MRKITNLSHMGKRFSGAEDWASSAVYQITRNQPSHNEMPFGKIALHPCIHLSSVRNTDWYKLLLVRVTLVAQSPCTALGHQRASSGTWWPAGWLECSTPCLSADGTKALGQPSSPSLWTRSSMPTDSISEGRRHLTPHITPGWEVAEIPLA